MRYLFLMLMLVMSGSAGHAQQPEEKPLSNEAVQAVIDDDGGRAFIVNSKMKSLMELRRLAGATIVSPQQYTIFFGSRWATPELRARESMLSNLLASIKNQPDANKLSALGINNFFGPTYSQEVLTNFENDERISDIRIRMVLSDLVKNGLLPLSEPSTIYVIFLQPDLRSTLGRLTGRKHYLAYHQFVNIAGRRLHYVVVPYEDNVETAKAIALRGLVAAALNPKGEIGN